MTCFVSIYKCFARPSQGLFLCTALSCRALQSSTRLRRGASATRHQPVSQLPSGTLAALQVFAGEIRASANSSSSDLGVLRTRTSAALVARLFGRRQRHQPTSRLPSRTLAALHVLAGGASCTGEQELVGFALVALCAASSADDCGTNRLL